MTIQHLNIPDAQIHQARGAATASAGQILTATGAGTATFVTPPYSIGKSGIWDYQDVTTQTTPIAITLANTEYQLTNDGAGVNSSTTYKLVGVDNVWNTATNYFDFTDLTLGDSVDIRVTIQITTISPNNSVSLVLEPGIGSTPYKLYSNEIFYKTAGVHEVSMDFHIYIGNTLTLDNPAKLSIRNTDVGSTVKVTGWFVRAIKNG